MKKILKQANNEHGFTIIEVVIAIIIIGILAAISIPAMFKYQEELDSQAQKAQLQSASILIEQEQVDNNGLFPKYIPNEIKSNPDMTGYVYTYSDDRTKFCLQANTPSGKWFISSENKTPNQVVCTQPNVGQGSNTPWKNPTIAVPTFISSSNTWATTSSAALSTVKLNPVTCVLDTEDSTEWGSSAVTSYSIKIQNTTRNQTITTPWTTSTTTTASLTNWLPGDTINYSAQARCTITSGTAYSYNSAYSPARADTVASFIVSPANYTSTPVLSWDTGDTVASYTAAWTTAFCPSGTMQYSLEVLQDGAIKDTTNRLAWATSKSKDLSTAVVGGKATILRHNVACVLSDGRIIESANTDANLTTPLKPPAAPAAINADDAAGTTPVLPNRLYWSAVACAVGTPQYRLNVTAPTTGSSAWMTVTSSSQSFVAETTYTYTAQAKCVNGSLSSALSPVSPSVTFTARLSIPTTPSTPVSLSSDNAGDAEMKNDRLIWSSVTCDAGATANYSIQQVVKNGAAITSTPTGFFTGNSYKIQSGWLAWGSTLGFQIKAKCVNATGVSGDTPWSSTYQFTTNITTPQAPYGVTNNGWGQTRWSNIAAADADTSRPNQWLRTIVSKSTGSGTIPSYADQPTGSATYIADSLNPTVNIADNYVGMLRTVVNVSTTRTISFTATHDDGGQINVDGQPVYQSGAYTPSANVSFTMQAGTHTLDFLWAEQYGGDGWNNFSRTIGSQVNSMYAPNTTTDTQCPAGTTAWYQLNHTVSNANANNGLSEWMTVLLREVNYNQGYPQATRVKVECRGPNATSASSNWSNTTSWTSNISTPGVIANWSNRGPSGSYGENWNAYSCPAGTTVRYWMNVRGASAGQSIWGPGYQYSAGYNRGAYNDGGSSMIHSSIYVECYTNYRSSARGAESYHYY